MKTSRTERNWRLTQACSCWHPLHYLPLSHCLRVSQAHKLKCKSCKISSIPTIDTWNLQKVLLSYRQDPTFWRILTRATFRIPAQPLLQADGARWQWLYKHLATQTQLFTWGNDDKGSLGHTAETQVERLQISAGRGSRRPLRSLGKRSGWPRRVKIEEIEKDVGVVADVQCGWVMSWLGERCGNKTWRL